MLFEGIMMGLLLVFGSSGIHPFNNAGKVATSV